MNLLRFALALLFVLPSCCSTFAQIELSFTAAQSLVGATTPKIVGDRILIGADSKPQISSCAIVKVVCSERVRLRARKSLYEEAELLPLTDGLYLLLGKGEYLIEAMSASFDRSLKVVVADDVPLPEPIVDPLSGVAKDARVAIVSLVQGMSADMQTIAKQVQSGQLKTVSEASTATNALDVTTRESFKRSMAKTMQPVLGSGQLPANSPQVFQEISKGFGSVK